MPVHAVGYRQREFRGHRIGGELAAGDPHDLIAQQAEQPHQPRTARQAHPPGLSLRRYWLALKKRKYRLSGDVASCNCLTGS